MAAADSRATTGGHPRPGAAAAAAATDTQTHTHISRHSCHSLSLSLTRALTPDWHVHGRRRSDGGNSSSPAAAAAAALTLPTAFNIMTKYELCIYRYRHMLAAHSGPLVDGACAGGGAASWPGRPRCPPQDGLTSRACPAHLPGRPADQSDPASTSARRLRSLPIQINYLSLNNT